MASVHPPRQGKKERPPSVRRRPRSLESLAKTLRLLEAERALELERRIGRHVGETELNADIEGELHLRRAGDFVLTRLGVGFAADVVVVAGGIVEQRRANTVILTLEGARIRKIFDLPEHLNARAPAGSNLVLGTPTISEAKAISVCVTADQSSKIRVGGYQQRSSGKLGDRAELDLIGIAAAGRKSIGTGDG